MHASQTVAGLGKLVAESRQLRAESLQASAGGVEHRVRERLRELREVEELTQAAVTRCAWPRARGAVDESAQNAVVQADSGQPTSTQPPLVTHRPD